MEQNLDSNGIIILAAGLGTRMKSNIAKVLHEIDGVPMITHVVKTASQVSKNNIVVVVGHQSELVKEVLTDLERLDFADQDQQLGTGHAVKCAMPYIKVNTKHVIILYGDVPLLSKDTIKVLLNKHLEDNNKISVLAVEVDDPTGYGRIIVDDIGNILKIVEEADANKEEKQVKRINTGIYCVEKEYLKASLDKIQANNQQKEYYLTDIVEIGRQDNKKIKFILSENQDEVMGINSQEELKIAEKRMQNK